MAENANGPDNLVLRYLRLIDTRLERVEHKLLEHDHEFAALRASSASLKGDFARLEGDPASQFGHWLRLEQRVERSERRLQLVDEEGPP